MRIPKRALDRYAKTVPKFQKVLPIAKDRDVNESDTVAILTDILSEVFGYDKYLEITSEYAIRSTFCDIAIKIDEKVQFLIEAKAIGTELKDSHLRQVIGYGANHGVQWVILTNGIDWKVYRIRFEQPVNYDLVGHFDFTKLNCKNEKDQELLFLISKSGLAKNVREDYYERVQSVNRFVIGNLILAEPIIAVVRRELRKLADGMKIDNEEIEHIIRTEVLKREIVESEDSEEARVRVNKFYKKSAVRPKKPIQSEKVEEIEPEKTVSFSDQLLQESDSPGDSEAAPDDKNETEY